MPRGGAEVPAMPVVVCWLRECMRVHDNPPLAVAASLSRKNEAALAIVAHRKHSESARDIFHQQCCSDLHTSLELLGNGLHVLQGNIAVELTRMNEHHKITHIVYALSIDACPQ